MTRGDERVAAVVAGPARISNAPPAGGRGKSPVRRQPGALHQRLLGGSPLDAAQVRGAIQCLWNRCLSSLADPGQRSIENSFRAAHRSAVDAYRIVDPARAPPAIVTATGTPAGGWLRLISSRREDVIESQRHARAIVVIKDRRQPGRSPRVPAAPAGIPARSPPPVAADTRHRRCRPGSSTSRSLLALTNGKLPARVATTSGVVARIIGADAGPCRCPRCTSQSTCDAPHQPFRLQHARRHRHR